MSLSGGYELKIVFSGQAMEGAKDAAGSSGIAFAALFHYPSIHMTQEPRLGHLNHLPALDLDPPTGFQQLPTAQTALGRCQRCAIAFAGPEISVPGIPTQAATHADGADCVCPARSFQWCRHAAAASLEVIQDWRLKLFRRCGQKPKGAGE